uniref:Uncharacterized protein n=1 Tax=Arundo donax TaxID=35708 RepID=A0A0A8YKH6_ARUDO
MSVQQLISLTCSQTLKYCYYCFNHSFHSSIRYYMLLPP